MCGPNALTIAFNSPASSVTFCSPEVLTLTVTAQAAAYISIPDASMAHTVTVTSSTASTVYIKAINLNTLTLTTPAATLLNITVPVAIILDLNKPFGATVRLIAPTSPKITLDAEAAGRVYVSTTLGSVYLTAPNATFTYVQSTFGKTQSIDAHLASPVVVDAPQTLTFTVSCAEFGQVQHFSPDMS
ncbi:MAG: hypothetical protein WDW36_000349 [Sanguina aurantia]